MEKNNLSANHSLIATRQVLTGNYSQNPIGYKEVKQWYEKLKN
ncbi:hypothetical protein [Elizabethkingia argenteiflava]|nr:hypothetical protein [Elizabethkingia argenteiflava]